MGDIQSSLDVWARLAVISSQENFIARDGTIAFAQRIKRETCGREPNRPFTLIVQVSFSVCAAKCTAKLVHGIEARVPFRETGSVRFPCEVMRTVRF
jgi:hypothetical protein